MEFINSIVSYISKIISDNIETQFSTSMNETQFFILEIFLFLIVSVVSFVLVVCVLILLFMLIYLILTKFFTIDKNNGRHICAFIIPFNIISIPLLMLRDYIKYDSIQPWSTYVLIMLVINVIIFIGILYVFKKGQGEK